jgi:hypothetical protein
MREKIENFDIKNDFIEFLDLSMSMSYDLMRAFHRFLGEGYSYTEADLEYFDAYSLYVLRSDGIEKSGHEVFKRASAFAEKYSKTNVLLNFTRELLKQTRDIGNLPRAYFNDILFFILKSYKNFSDDEIFDIRDCIAHRILNDFSNPGFKAFEFEDIFKYFDSLCARYGYKLIQEFVRDVNREQLKAALQQDDINIDKIKILINYIFQYVKGSAAEYVQFKPDSDSGVLFTAILESVFTSHPEMGESLIRHIINTFGTASVYLLLMIFYIDNLADSYPNDSVNNKILWEYYYKTVSKYQDNRRTAVIDWLLKHKSYDRIYALFNVILNDTRDIENCRKIFEEHLERIIMQYEQYRIFYAGKILTSYYNRLLESNTEAAEEAKHSLLYLVLKHQLKVDFINELSQNITEKIPLAQPSDEQVETLKTIINYITRNKQKPGKRLKLFAAGIIVTEHFSKGYNKGKDMLIRYSNDEGYDLEGLSEEEQIRYIEWIEPVIFEFCTKADDLKTVYGLFNMTKKTREKFLDSCMQYKLKQSNFKPLCEYLLFIFSINDADAFMETGRSLSRLNKAKMELLDKEMNERFETEKKIMSSWVKMRRIALSTNPILNTLSKMLSK